LCPPEQIEDFLRTRLQKTGEQAFPYYLQHTKRFGLFVIGREENEKL